MKSKKKMYTMFFVIMIAVLIIGFTMIMPKSKEINEKSIQTNTIELIKEKDIVSISEIAKFPWTKAYVISPYMPEKEVAKKLGVSTLEISEGVSEGMNHIIFMNNEKLECEVYSNAYDAGYLFDFDYEYFDDGMLELNSKDEHKFKVKKDDGFIRLKHINKNKK